MMDAMGIAELLFVLVCHSHRSRSADMEPPSSVLTEDDAHTAICYRALVNTIARLRSANMDDALLGDLEGAWRANLRSTLSAANVLHRATRWSQVRAVKPAGEWPKGRGPGKPEGGPVKPENGAAAPHISHPDDPRSAAASQPFTTPAVYPWREVVANSAIARAFFLNCQESLRAPRDGSAYTPKRAEHEPALKAAIEDEMRQHRATQRDALDTRPLRAHRTEAPAANAPSSHVAAPREPDDFAGVVAQTMELDGDAVGDDAWAWFVGDLPKAPPGARRGSVCGYVSNRRGSVAEVRPGVRVPVHFAPGVVKLPDGSEFPYRRLDIEVAAGARDH
jgi:hypothetical protein